MIQFPFEDSQHENKRHNDFDARNQNEGCPNETFYVTELIRD